MNSIFWKEGEWEADWFSPYLVLTTPNGESGTVVIQDAKTRRNVTLGQFRDAARTHGMIRACEVFWKLRANQ